MATMGVKGLKYMNQMYCTWFSGSLCISDNLTDYTPPGYTVRLE